MFIDAWSNENVSIPVYGMYKVATSYHHLRFNPHYELGLFDVKTQQGHTILVRIALIHKKQRFKTS
jgi:hypothetical protein